MAKVLGGEIPMNDLNAYYFGYMHSLKNTENASLKQANSVWIRDNKEMIEVPDTFLQIVKSNYDAQVFRAPFDTSTVTDVNNWVNFHTEGMIPKIIENVSDDTVMYLINALAFDAKWANPYNQYEVSEGQFTTAEGDKVTVDMMNGTEYTYLEDENAIGFIKSYKDYNYSFAAILPNEGVSVTDYIKSMTGESLQKLLASARNETVFTEMPKFDFDYGLSLKKPLKTMGMPTAFDSEKADFSGLNTKLPTYISDVIHKTHITVDEEGTRAAAVTAVIMEAGCALVEPKEVYLTRPFLFMILDENTKLPVFIGAVANPAA
jgi:serpin B